MMVLYLSKSEVRCGDRHHCDRHHCDCRHYDLHHRCDRHLSLSFVDCSVLSGS
ncbi:hypothetical protein [Eubacterium callanderi]|uniref:hypothetical protein n=1 Tax=Eubacterium callanderi TaxID=53442 RepID=UPI003AF00175